MKEGEYQKHLKEKIKELLPGSIVLKNDPTWIQGIPDLTILHGDRWASLEVKKSKKEPHQPNQDYYVDKMDGMAFSSFIFPENEEEVLNDLQRALEPRGASCVSKP